MFISNPCPKTQLKLSTLADSYPHNISFLTKLISTVIDSPSLLNFKTLLCLIHHKTSLHNEQLKILIFQKLKILKHIKEKTARIIL